jgi:hypothetical protein
MAASAYNESPELSNPDHKDEAVSFLDNLLNSRQELDKEIFKEKWAIWKKATQNPFKIKIPFVQKQIKK